MARIRLEGVEEFAARLQAVKDFDPAPALERAAERLMNRIRDQPDFPYLTGDLQRSGRVDGANLFWDDLVYAGPVERRRQFFEPIAVEELPLLVEEELKIALDEAVGGDDG